MSCMMKKSILFNTGFLSCNDSIIRQKQGLQPQNISNNCLTNTCICNNELLYPIKEPDPSTKIGMIPDCCSCTRYVRAP